MAPKKSDNYLDHMDSLESFLSFCKENGIPESLIFTSESKQDGDYLIEKDGKWLVYESSRGCKYETQEFDNYKMALEAAAKFVYHRPKI